MYTAMIVSSELLHELRITDGALKSFLYQFYFATIIDSCLKSYFFTVKIHPILSLTEIFNFLYISNRHVSQIGMREELCS